MASGIPSYCTASFFYPFPGRASGKGGSCGERRPWTAEARPVIGSAGSARALTGQHVHFRRLGRTMITLLERGRYAQRGQLGRASCRGTRRPKSRGGTRKLRAPATPTLASREPALGFSAGRSRPPASAESARAAPPSLRVGNAASRGRARVSIKMSVIQPCASQPGRGGPELGEPGAR